MKNSAALFIAESLDYCFLLWWMLDEGQAHLSFEYYYRWFLFIGPLLFLSYLFLVLYSWGTHCKYKYILDYYEDFTSRYVKNALQLLLAFHFFRITPNRRGYLYLSLLYLWNLIDWLRLSAFLFYWNIGDPLLQLLHQPLTYSYHHYLAFAFLLYELEQLFHH